MEALEITKDLINDILDRVFETLKEEYQNEVCSSIKIDPAGNIHRSEDVDDQDMNISVVFNQKELYFSKVFFEFDMYADPHPDYYMAGDKDISKDVKDIIGEDTWYVLDNLRSIYFNLMTVKESGHADA